MTFAPETAPIEHCSISKPETGVRVTEMVIYHRLSFIFVISCKQSVNSRVVIYLLIVIHRLRSSQPRLFLRQKFPFQMHYGTKNRRRKPAPVSGARVMGINKDDTCSRNL